MKNIIKALSMMIIVLLILTGCGKNKTENVENSTHAKSAIEKGNDSSMTNSNQMFLTINGHQLTGSLVENSSTKALRKLLEQGPVTLSMHDYGNMEKVGDIGTTLPTNDEQITTEAGDIILYQGSSLVIYYAPNTWNFTRLGKINGVSAKELKEILGDGDVEVVLSLD